MPGPHGWYVVRSAAQNGSWEVRAFATLDELAPSLGDGDEYVLALPVSAVLAQRLRLPTVEAGEFPEMVRLQIEKALPYSAEELTTDFEVIEQTEQGSVVSAIAVHNERLSELAAPLLASGRIPKQITVYAAQRGATHAAEGRALIIYPEGESLVSAITENGKLSLARVLDGVEPQQLRADLPHLALSAQMEGIDTAFPNVLLDESCFDLRETIEGVFSSRPSIVAIERPPAATKLNLLPESWREKRAQVLRLLEWRKRLIWAGAAYGGLLLLLIAYLVFMKIEIHWLDRKIAQDAPRTQFVKATETTWRSLAPAIDPHYYPIEVLLHLSESLPSPEVHITAFNQSARQISVDGESNNASLAYQFAEKVKKNPDLRMFQFEMGAPRILPNDHAQFRLEGKPR
ncbi:MAG: hypothetical protein QOI04_951 [Verrucomicrobiota bacterium]|jgi:hypothetical protein